ncbi:MAG: RluA family pseudouridine synthase [Lachnospiraceae bacterium]|nr:RluA family pseudouridine synthase [Lachnospiraceae bacterium]
MKQLEFTITEEFENERIDKYLSEFIDSFSRSFLQKLIDQNDISVNGKSVKPSYRLKIEDDIQVNVPESIVPDIKPEDIPLDILYEDDDVIVINKPKGMVVHPAPGNYEHTLVNALMYHCGSSLSGINGVLRPGIVHRIDKNTTGSLIICKNDISHQKIADALKTHDITRKYHAIVHGIINEENGTIKTLIGRSQNDRTKMAVVPAGGREAVTHFKVLERFNGYTYVECELETGRTHQIRVHMAHINHPVLGDDKYCTLKNPFKLEGQCLHAKILGFEHPRTGEHIMTDAPLPEYFTHLLDVLRKNK